MGSGARLDNTQSQWQALDISNTAPQPDCANVWLLTDVQPGATGLPAQTVNIAFQCNGVTGRTRAGFNFVLNGQQLACARLLAGHSAGVNHQIYCAVNQQAALTCAQSIHGGTSVANIQMAFFP